MRRLFALQKAGVLGLNRRNAEYLLRWNRRKFYPIVDNKLETKRRCQAAGIPVPELLAVAEHHFELRDLLSRIGDRSSFVLKPARGAMGNGIIAVHTREEKRFQRAGGRWIDENELLYHAAGIISGLYALAGHSDVAMVEERLEIHPAFQEIAQEGVPDLRVIVYRGVPVMSMARLPTLRSLGRANLHQGAIGAGVELHTGITRFAILNNRPVRSDPDTGKSVIGRSIPAFAKALEIAVAATDQTELGYVGADVVVDASKGPVILELNARPGLAIQLANRAGLLPRLQEVDRRWQPQWPMAARLEAGREIAAALEVPR